MNKALFIALYWLVAVLIIHWVTYLFTRKVIRPKIKKIRTTIRNIMFFLSVVFAIGSTLLQMEGYSFHLVMTAVLMMGFFWAISHGLR